MNRSSLLQMCLAVLGLALGPACGKSPRESAPVKAEWVNPEKPTAVTTADVASGTGSASAGQSQPPSVPALPSLAPLVDSVKAAVVNVDVRSRVAAPARVSGSQPWDDFFDRFFGPQGRMPLRPREQIRAGVGSGFIIDPNGVALTNNHVVQGAIAIQVRLNDGRSFEASVLGRDPLTDVAVIKFKGNAKDLPLVRLGDSDAMHPGDWVVAIGNPFGLASSVSAGIISAKDRQIGAGPYDDFLQTDAAINPGNSGGPLFNMQGEVIGINTAIIGGGAGIGFAVPSNLAKALLPQLEKDGQVIRGWVGIGAQNLTLDLAKALGVPAKEGAVVVEVNEETPAHKAGLKPDDVVVAVDGRPVGSASELTRLISLKQPGSSVVLTFYRGATKQEAKVTLGTRPDIEGVGGSSNISSDEEGRQRRIGLHLQDVDRAFARARNSPPEGAVITDVAPGSAADYAGLAPGMVVVEAGGKPIKRGADLKKVLREAKPGSVLLLRVDVQGSKLLLALNIPS